MQNLKLNQEQIRLVIQLVEAEIQERCGTVWTAAQIDDAIKESVIKLGLPFSGQDYDTYLFQDETPCK